MTNKKILQRYLQELRLFKSAHTAAVNKGVVSIYDIHILYRNADGLMSKVQRFAPSGLVYLPDFCDKSNVISFYIDKLTLTQITKFLEDCDRYGITE